MRKLKSILVDIKIMLKLPPIIKTLETESEFRLKEKGSFFLSISKPVENEEEATSFLNSIRKKYYDATHHCYSYKFVDGQFKYSDDGEPNGTAGIRIYNAQNHFELTNLITIVVRYFGGTKLGVGPLGKAYYNSSFQNLNSSSIIEQQLYQHAEINYHFDQSKTVHHLISKHQAIVRQSIYDPSPIIQCLVPVSQSKIFNGEKDSLQHNGINVELKENFEYLKK